MIEVITNPSTISDRLPVFGTKEFLSTKSSTYGWLVSPEFALPFIVEKRLCFTRLIFTTETIHLVPNATVEAETEFLDEVIGVCNRGKDLTADFVSTAQANAVFRTVPAGSEHISWGSYVVDLEQPEAVVFSRFHSKHRNVIRNAEANGVSVTTTSDTGRIYNSLKETMVRQGLLFYPSQERLDTLQRNLKENVSFYIAEQNGELQGTAVVVHNHLGAFYYYGGSNPRPLTGSLNLMQFEIMKDLQRRNVPVYDLMGARMNTGGDAKIEGIQRFKSRFASSMRQGYCFRYVVKPFKHRLFGSAVKAFFLMKGSRYAGDVIDQAGHVSAVPAEAPAPALRST